MIAIEIKNLKQLREEKERLKMQISISSQLIAEDFHTLKQTLNPLKAVGDVTQNLLFNKQEGALNDGLRNMIGTFAYNNLLTALPWPLRMGASYLLKNVASNFLYSNKDTIFNKVKDVVSNLRNLKSAKR